MLNQDIVKRIASKLYVVFDYYPFGVRNKDANILTKVHL